MDTRTVKIFLASSAELRADRDAFKLNIARRNDAWAAHGVRLEVLAWETFLDAMSQRGLQEGYHGGTWGQVSRLPVKRET